MFSLYPLSCYLPEPNYHHGSLRLLQYPSKWPPYTYFNTFSTPQTEWMLYLKPKSERVIPLLQTFQWPTSCLWENDQNPYLAQSNKLARPGPCSSLLPPPTLCSSHSPQYPCLSFPVLTVPSAEESPLLLLSHLVMFTGAYDSYSNDTSLWSLPEPQIQPHPLDHSYRFLCMCVW